jgi:hypothetical protein
MPKPNPFTNPEIIRLAVMLYIRFPLLLRNVEDILLERGIEVSHETVRFYWNRRDPPAGCQADARVAAMGALPLASGRRSPPELRAFRK